MIAEINRRLEQHVQSVRHDRLREAMAYSLLSEGKRLRPLLVLASAAAAAPSLSEQETREFAWPAALAIEYVQTYSLVHDDLPAMDDDDMRRGKPSNHIAFGEATAILVGDALLTDAFAILADAKINAAKQVAQLAQAIGSDGMVAGQQMDIDAAIQTHSTRWLDIHALKTGRLFSCACVLGALAVNGDNDVVERLQKFGQLFGLAFQLTDDLLDNAPLVAQMGRAEVERMADEAAAAAIQLARRFGANGERLVALTTVAMARQG